MYVEFVCLNCNVLGKANSQRHAIVTSKATRGTHPLENIKCWTWLCAIFSSLLIQFRGIFCSSSPSSSDGLTRYISPFSRLSFHPLLEHSCAYMFSYMLFCFLSHANWCFLHLLQVMEANKSSELKCPSFMQVVVHDNLLNRSMSAPPIMTVNPSLVV